MTQKYATYHFTIDKDVLIYFFIGEHIQHIMALQGEH